ncbi:cyclophilin-like fold protein [Bradyrhizobium sp. 149]|uniref:cyclophilin-like fold protein n=1 Tax=Bradyrhizobium sp. 149 TaxID=2782624 RepID=UPI001FF8506E|nr:cyclophilin-like fold protein [Bradyrhizobium sp. 149]
MTIELSDHLRQKKTGSLPLPLPEVSRQRDFELGTLGLWGPDHFVIYYRKGRVPQPGIVILGNVIGDVSVFDRLGPIAVRIEVENR